MILKLDIRAKLLLLFIANILMFKKMGVYEHLIIAIFFSLLVGIIFNFMRATRLFSIYLFLTLYEIYFGKIVTIPIIDNFLLMSIMMFKTVYFPFCAGVLLIGSSKVSELIAFLRSVKMPNSVIIVLAVIFRFFPAMIMDYKHIKNSLKLKGIGLSKFYYLRHPLKFMEYVFVPYVIISTNIANDLSISILCRGIDSGEKPTSIHKLKYKMTDYIFSFVITILFILVEVKL